MRSYRKLSVSLLSIVLLLSMLILPVQAAMLDDVRELIENLYIDQVDDKVLQALTVEEMLKELDDPHSAYFTAEQYQAFLESIGDSSFTGLGVQIDSVPEGILVIRVLPGSPAEEAHIKPGDIIISVDEKSLIGMAVEEAVPIIRGPEGSSINIIIKRGDTTTPVSCIRKTIVLPSVKGELLPGDIGYIDIDSFGLETPGEFRQTLDDLRSQGADSYIIDLRNNGGGYLMASLDIAGYFIGNDIALNAEAKDNRTRAYPAFGHAYTINEPLIFLVNEFSASASEILAAAVKDYNQALVIGNTTFGKGTVQSLYHLSSGEGALKLTTSRFFSPLGNSIDGIGITPDLTITKSDPLKAAQLLLGYSDYTSMDTPNVTLRIGRSNYTVDTNTANTPAYWTAYLDIISELPYYTLYRVGDQSDWQVANPHQLADLWPFYYPNYTKLSHLEGIPIDKQFSLTYPNTIDRKLVNKETIQLIEANTGQQIPLDFLFLGSKQVVLTPKTKLAADTTYWLVIQPGVEHKGQGKLEGSITTIRVGNSERIESVKISAVPGSAA